MRVDLMRCRPLRQTTVNSSGPSHKALHSAAGYSITLVLDKFAVFCFSVLAAFSIELLETKHKTKRILKQNTRFAIPSSAAAAAGTFTIGGVSHWNWR